MKKLLVFTLYGERGGSSQYRAYIFKKEFEKEFNTEWHNFWNDKYATKYMHNKRKYFFPIAVQYTISAVKRLYQLVFIAPKVDVLFIQKACIPKVKKTFLMRAKSRGVRVVFDIDDATYLFNNDNTDDIARIADVVVCGNETLKAHYDSVGCKCVVLPTVENTPLFEAFWQDTFNNKVIGWIGSASSVHNLELLVDPINQLVKIHPEIRFDIICNDDQGYVNRIKNSRLVVWDKNSYISNMSNFTIGVMPLKDTGFNQGKCGFKLIQYLNMKKPVVGSGVGVNAQIIEGNGIVANNSMEWVNALEELLFCRNTYDRCIEHIDNTFFDEYHFSKVSNALVKILKG